jgi:hypothetical protein
MKSDFVGVFLINAKAENEPSMLYETFILAVTGTINFEEFLE